MSIGSDYMNTKCPFCGVVYDGELKKCPECGKNPTLVYILGMIIIITVVGFVIMLFTDSSSNKDMGNWSKEKSAECYNKSNTYYKCRWNVIEDRCTCKQR